MSSNAAYAERGMKLLKGHPSALPPPPLLLLSVLCSHVGVI